MMIEKGNVCSVGCLFGVCVFGVFGVFVLEGVGLGFRVFRVYAPRCRLCPCRPCRGEVLGQGGGHLRSRAPQIHQIPNPIASRQLHRAAHRLIGLPEEIGREQCKLELQSRRSRRRLPPRAEGRRRRRRHHRRPCGRLPLWAGHPDARSVGEAAGKASGGDWRAGERVERKGAEFQL